MEGNDARVLRDRHRRLEDDLDRARYKPPDAGRALLVQTTQDQAYPTSAGVMYCVVEVEASGSEQEGATPSFAADSQSNKFYALNLGTGIPDQGTQHLARYAGGKWCFRYDG